MCIAVRYEVVQVKEESNAYLKKSNNGAQVFNPVEPQWKRETMQALVLVSTDSNEK